MKKALFLDRDGVLNRERGEYTFELDDFEVLPDVSAALKEAKRKNYLLIVISNQGGIAKGIFSKERVEELHGKLSSELQKSNIDLDEIYYCPHHDDVGKCLCRKPQPLMLQKAIARFNIDVSQSVFIGDGERDILAAEAAGVRGIRIDANSGILQLCRELP
ncbi:MAG: HAD-IIIA family hydrolase [Flavobacteriales bacterium]|nr:HAD-IIIA family hydrolase [Flavobacteriales bacterium]